MTRMGINLRNMTDMTHYIDADKLKAEIGNRYDNMLNRAKLDSENANYWNGKADAYRAIYDHIDSLQQEQDVLEFSFKGGTYRVNGEERTFKSGKAKVVILEIMED